MISNFIQQRKYRSTFRQDSPAVYRKNIEGANYSPKPIFNKYNPQYNVHKQINRGSHMEIPSSHRINSLRAQNVIFSQKKNSKTMLKQLSDMGQTSAQFEIQGSENSNSLKLQQMQAMKQNIMGKNVHSTRNKMMNEDIVAQSQEDALAATFGMSVQNQNQRMQTSGQMGKPQDLTPQLRPSGNMKMKEHCLLQGSYDNQGKS